mmetsp:Transcript_36475/g.56980  ORF Transcript_36475/g.56980 Transcript_36475/m.56980 type:complete len:172 (+) Transcript_36475:1-516(+)
MLHVTDSQIQNPPHNPWTHQQFRLCVFSFTVFGLTASSIPGPAVLESYAQLLSPQTGYTVYEGCQLSRAYKLFRHMGLRHLPVVNSKNEVLGMLTRSCFSDHNIFRALRTNYRDEELLLLPHKQKFSRMKTEELLHRQRAREGMQGAQGQGVGVGGVLKSWQVRLAERLGR